MMRGVTAIGLGLALALQLFHHFKSLEVDKASRLKG